MARYYSIVSYMSKDRSVFVSLYHSSLSYYRVYVNMHYSNGTDEIVETKNFEYDIMSAADRRKSLKAAKVYALALVAEYIGTDFIVYTR